MAFRNFNVGLAKGLRYAESSGLPNLVMFVHYERFYPEKRSYCAG